jgi:hypothetical protein
MREEVAVAVVDVASGYPEIQEFVWLASDRNDHVGAFSSYLAGPIPSIVLASPDPGRGMELLEELALRRSSEARIVTGGGGEIREWMNLARRGIFSFEWDFLVTSNRYEPIAAPVVPIRVDDLPDELALIARATKFSALSFLDAPSIDPRRYFSCVESERYPLRDR